MARSCGCSAGVVLLPLSRAGAASAAEQRLSLWGALRGSLLSEQAVFAPMSMRHEQIASFFLTVAAYAI